MSQVYEDGWVHVRAAQCDRCLFSRDRLVSGGRARQIVADSRSEPGGSFICHRGQVSTEHTAICFVWWQQYAERDWLLRLAIGLGIVKRVPDES